MTEKEQFKQAVLEMIDEKLPEEAFTGFNPLSVELDIKFKDRGHKGFGFFGYVVRCDNEITFIKKHEENKFLSAISWGKEFKRPVVDVEKDKLDRIREVFGLEDNESDEPLMTENNNQYNAKSKELEKTVINDELKNKVNDILNTVVIEKGKIIAVSLDVSVLTADNAGVELKFSSDYSN